MNVIAVKPAGAELHRLGDDIPAGVLSGTGEHGHQLITLGDGEPRFAILREKHTASFVFLRCMDVDGRRKRIAIILQRADA